MWGCKVDISISDNDRCESLFKSRISVLLLLRSVLSVKCSFVGKNWVITESNNIMSVTLEFLSHSLIPEQIEENRWNVNHFRIHFLDECVPVPWTWIRVKTRADLKCWIFGSTTCYNSRNWKFSIINYSN